MCACVFNFSCHVFFFCVASVFSNWVFFFFFLLFRLISSYVMHMGAFRVGWLVYTLTKIRIKMRSCSFLLSLSFKQCIEIETFSLRSAKSHTHTEHKTQCYDDWLKRARLEPSNKITTGKTIERRGNTITLVSLQKTVEKTRR